MTLKELQTHIQVLLDNGVSENIPVKFRNNQGKHEDIDYSVYSNDYKSILFAQEWFS